MACAKVMVAIPGRLAGAMPGYSFHVGLSRDVEHRFSNRNYGYSRVAGGRCLCVLGATMDVHQDIYWILYVFA